MSGKRTHSFTIAAGEKTTLSTSEHLGPLPLTGERTVPGIPHENYWFRRHEAAYRHIAAQLHGAAVVEAGCGEGYGTALLAGIAGAIVGLDYDQPTVLHAARRYPGVTFVRANLAAFPFRTHSADAVVSLQVIEHVWNHTGFLGECHRVLRPGGRLLLTTPNRLTFSPGRDEPLNPFHTKEFCAAELVSLVEASGFATDEVLGLHAGTRLAGFDRQFGGSFVDAQLATPPTAWPEELRRAVAGVTVEDFDILASDVHGVDEALDLVVLARRVA